jgi:hypothetical protein
VKPEKIMAMYRGDMELQAKLMRDSGIGETVVLAYLKKREAISQCMADHGICPDEMKAAYQSLHSVGLAEKNPFEYRLGKRIAKKIYALGRAGLPVDNGIYNPIDEKGD